MTSKPNIILISTDQQRTDLKKGDVFPCDTMPFLEEMAVEGCDFRQAYTPLYTGLDLHARASQAVYRTIPLRASYDIQPERLFDEYLAELRRYTDFNPAPYGVEAQCPDRNVTKALDWIDTVKDERCSLWLSFAEPHNP